MPRPEPRSRWRRYETRRRKAWAVSATPASARFGPLSERRVALSEWTKLRSVRSTGWSALVTLLLIVGIGILVCVVFNSRWPHLSADERAHFNALRASLAGVAFGQLAIGVLGVLVLWGKALVFGLFALVLTLPAVFIVFFAGQAILSGQHINISASHPGVIRSLFGAGLYLTVMGLFGLGLGTIVRSTAGGIATLAGIVFVLPPVIGLLPSSVANSVNPYLPSNAGGAVWTIHPDPHTLAPWAGFGVFCAYAAAALAIGGILLLRRDA